jgi:hypothetical protein
VAGDRGAALFIQGRVVDEIACRGLTNRHHDVPVKVVRPRECPGGRNGSTVTVETADSAVSHVPLVAVGLGGTGSTADVVRLTVEGGEAGSPGCTVAADAVCDRRTAGPAHYHAGGTLAIGVAIGSVAGGCVAAGPGAGVVDQAIGVIGAGTDNPVSIDGLGMTLGTAEKDTIHCQLIDVLGMHAAVHGCGRTGITPVTTGAISIEGGASPLGIQAGRTATAITVTGNVGAGPVGSTWGQFPGEADGSARDTPIGCGATTVQCGADEPAGTPLHM